MLYTFTFDSLPDPRSLFFLFWSYEVHLNCSAMYAGSGSEAALAAWDKQLVQQLGHLFPLLEAVIALTSQVITGHVSQVFRLIYIYIYNSNNSNNNKKNNNY